MIDPMLDPIPVDPWPRLLLLAVAGAILSAVLVRRMIRLAVMDVPVGRSAHDRPTPRGGGVGMVASVLLGVPAGLLLLSGSHPLPALLLVVSVLLLAVVSWLDDVRQFPPVWKLAAQGAASFGGVLAAAAGPGRGLFAGAGAWLPAHWSFLAAPLFLAGGFCWLMLCTNAVNFMDGLNGLAAGSCALVGAIAVPLGLATGDALLAVTGLMLAAGLIGFLPFNFPSARIFMGDVGSQCCGLLVGCFSLMLLADTGQASLALAGPLMLAGLLFDVVLTLARRLWARERITQAHRGHLYQVAARSGLSRVGVSLTEWWFVVWGAVVSAATLPRQPVLAIALVLLPQAAWALSVRQRARRAGLGRWS